MPDDEARPHPESRREADRADSAPDNRFWGVFAAHPVAPLAVAAIIPILLFAGWIAYRSAEQYRTAALKAAVDVVDRVAEKISGEIRGHVEAATTLASSLSLAEGNLVRFYQEAQRVQAERPAWRTVELDDPQGNQIINLLRPFAVELGATADIESFKAAIETREPVVGGIGPVGPVSGLRLISVRVPIVRDDKIAYVLTILFAPDAMAHILAQAGLPKGWIGAVIDAKGALIARSVQAPAAGMTATEAVRAANSGSDSGRYLARSLEGVEVETVFRAVSYTSGWSVHVGIPREALEAPVQRSLFALAGGVGASLALAAGLALFLSKEVTRQRQIEELRARNALAYSEERAALAIEGAELGTWRWNVESDVFLASFRCRDWLGLTARSEDEPASLLQAVHPDDRASVRQAALDSLRSGAPFQADFRTLPDAGPRRWLRARGRASATEGEISGVLSDISALRRAREERLELLRRLNESQEEIQRRIAHNLHDQVGQTVTGLSIGLKSLERDIERLGADPGADPAPALNRARWLGGLAGEIGRDIHQAAADLRPAALDDLGLVRALEALCKQWTERHGVEAELQVVGDVHLPSGAEAIIYRVIQEAMTNVLKHAKATYVSIVIERRSRELMIVIEDDGVGFSPDMEGAGGAGAESPRPRLGLSSMRERLSLIHGTMRIESSPGAGTTIFCQVPLDLSPNI